MVILVCRMLQTWVKSRGEFGRGAVDVGFVARPAALLLAGQRASLCHSGTQSVGIHFKEQDGTSG